jgi:hypothetical protein
VPTFDVAGLVKSELSVKERYELCRSVAEECIQVHYGHYLFKLCAKIIERCNIMPYDTQLQAPCAIVNVNPQDDELKRLLEVKDHPVCYDGFEPSGRMHIAQGVMRALNVNKLTKVVF